MRFNAVGSGSEEGRGGLVAQIDADGSDPLSLWPVFSTFLFSDGPLVSPRSFFFKEAHKKTPSCTLQEGALRSG